MLDRDATYLRKRMFGCDAAYVDGRLCLVAADRDKPWNGLLMCTAREAHASLVAKASKIQSSELRIVEGIGSISRVY